MKNRADGAPGRSQRVAKPGACGNHRMMSLVLVDDPSIFPCAGLRLAIRILVEGIQWVPVVDAWLPWGPVRKEPPSSQFLLALVMDVVTQRTRSPSGAGGAALPLDLAWAPDVRAAAFHDDALERVLEKRAGHGGTWSAPSGSAGERWARRRPPLCSTRMRRRCTAIRFRVVSNCRAGFRSPVRLMRRGANSVRLGTQVSGTNSRPRPQDAASV